MYSGVNTHSFMKHITAQEVSAEGLLGGLGEVVATLAGVEQLDAHRNAVLIRLEHLRGLK
jgi:phosphoribosyl-ATP pyrophosphohydrolase/phosphoribosyl-AMP cyclohydrolase/histidinol dehydrogenase